MKQKLGCIDTHHKWIKGLIMTRLTMLVVNATTSTMAWVDFNFIVIIKKTMLNIQTPWWENCNNNKNRFSPSPKIVHMVNLTLNLTYSSSCTHWIFNQKTDHLWKWKRGLQNLYNFISSRVWLWKIGLQTPIVSFPTTPWALM